MGDLHGIFMTASDEKGAGPRVLSISSGKGGVGKSHIVVNLALELCRMGRRVLVLDADLGLANIDILVGIRPEHTLRHLLTGARSIDDILVSVPGGFDLLPAGSGIEELTRLSLDQRLLLLEQLDRLAVTYDYILLDTGAGISTNVVYFNLCAGEVVLVVVPEPTSITDGYALIKVLNRNHGRDSFWILVNQVRHEEEAGKIFQKMRAVCSQHLGVCTHNCGSIRADGNVAAAARKQVPLLTLTPDSPAGRDICKVARFLDANPLQPPGEERFAFFRRLLQGRQE